MIDTIRCILKKFCVEDIETAIPLYTSYQVRKYLGGPVDEAEARKQLLDGALHPDGVYFSAFEKETGDFLGLFSVTPHHNPADQEISYALLPAFWGRGLASEILSAVLDFCKHTLHLDAVVSETQSKNVRSCALLEGAGYTLAETLMRFGEEQKLYKKWL